MYAKSQDLKVFNMLSVNLSSDKKRLKSDPLHICNRFPLTCFCFSILVLNFIILMQPCALFQGLWDLLSDNFSTSGPVVQRISKSVFVVKCKTSSKHPLGYLHLTIFNNVKHKNKADYRHYCACPVEYKVANNIVHLTSIIYYK